MPIFEYACKSCGHQFESLVMAGRKPQCPKCESTQLTQKLSVFAVASAGKSGRSPGNGMACGTCGDPRGPGSCALDDD